jgi:hypothetical protein
VKRHIEIERLTGRRKRKKLRGEEKERKNIEKLRKDKKRQLRKKERKKEKLGLLRKIEMTHKVDGQLDK